MLFAIVADSGLLELYRSYGCGIVAIGALLTLWELFFRSLSGFFAGSFAGRADFWWGLRLSC
jgi:hypothetical protein